MNEERLLKALQRIGAITSQGDKDEETWMEDMCMEPADTARMIRDINQIAVGAIKREVPNAE